MKRFSQWILTFGFLLFFVISLPQLLLAQADGGCDPLDPGCPIDGGVVILLIVGAAYGVKKILDSQKAKIEC